MSKFRIELDLSFNNEDDAVALINMVEGLKGKEYEGTGLEPLGVERKCRIHECFHDENPAIPCGNYTSVDFDNPDKTSKHKNKAGDIIEYTSIDIKTKKK